MKFPQKPSSSPFSSLFCKKYNFSSQKTLLLATFSALLFLAATTQATTIDVAPSATSLIEPDVIKGMELIFLNGESTGVAEYVAQKTGKKSGCPFSGGSAAASGGYGFGSSSALSDMKRGCSGGRPSGIDSSYGQDQYSSLTAAANRLRREDSANELEAAARAKAAAQFLAESKWRQQEREAAELRNQAEMQNDERMAAELIMRQQAEAQAGQSAMNGGSNYPQEYRSGGGSEGQTQQMMDQSLSGSSWESGDSSFSGGEGQHDNSPREDEVECICKAESQ